MAPPPPLIVSAYNHGHKEVLRVESFDSEDYSLLSLIATKESPP